MGVISAKEARGQYTKTLIALYKERARPVSFLRSFFQIKESVTKNISIEVQRGTERIAGDVQRGTEGNRNNFNRNTEKIFTPPYYREFFDATDLDLYERMMGDGDIEASVVAQFISDLADKFMMLQDKIERAYELQCAQVLETGIVETNIGDNINYLRRAEMLVDLTATPWTNNAYDPIKHIENGCKALRSFGRCQGGTFNVLMGSEVKSAFDNNLFIRDKGLLIRIEQLDLRMPQRESVGGTTHGKVAAGDYVANIWTYSEIYDKKQSDGSFVQTPYLNPKKMIILPESPNFHLSFAAVPQLMNGGALQKGAFVLDRYQDPRNTADIHDIKSAGLAVMTAVDHAYTAQPVQ